MDSARRGPSGLKGPRGLIASVTAALLTLGGLVLAPAAAVAAPAPADGATLDWDIQTSFSSYIVGSIANGTITATGSATASGTDLSWSGGSGAADVDVPEADVDFTGGIQFSGHDGQLEMTISDPNLVITSDTTGEIWVHVFSAGGSGFPATDETMKFADLTFDSLTVTETSISGTSATQALTAEASAVFADRYTDAAPVTFSIPVEQVAEATTTTLSVDPATGTADAGTTITLTATVSPSAAAGTVQFSSSTGVPLGAPQTVSGGTASISTDELPAGDYAFSAAFTPDDTDAYEPSASEESSFTVTVPVTAVATATALAAALPAGPVLLGTSTTLSATVTAVDSSVPVGSVEFFRIPAGEATPVSLGPVPVDGAGLATLPVALPAGGQAFRAVFTPTVLADFQASTSGTSGNYGVVDTAQPTVCAVPGDTAVSSTEATATWTVAGSIFNFAGPITRAASGNVTLDGKTFELAEGAVTATADCAKVAFTGTIELNIYPGQSIGDPKVVLANPTLVVDAQGAGAWFADVTVTVFGVANGPTAMALSTFSGAAVTPGGANDALSIGFDWAGVTAPGTWSVNNGAQTATWRNSFVWMLPANIRAHFHASGSGSDANKKPANLDIDFTWPAVTSLALAASPASPAIAGSPVTLTATVTPSAATGSVEFFETVSGGSERSLGSIAVSGGAAALPVSDLAGGAHTFRAEFTSEAYEPSAATAATAAAPYRVIDTSTPALCSIEGEAEQLTGVEIDWNWSAYSGDWKKFLDGVELTDTETFALTGGVATLGDDCLVVEFATTLRTEAYNSFFPEHGQWIELVDPALVLDADGNGAWVAGVRSGQAALNENTPVRLPVATITGAELPDFSGDSAAATIELDYAGTTARGTWSGSMTDTRTDAWANAFILQAPSQVRAFYYQSGAGRDGDKAPSPLQLSWNLADPVVSASLAEVQRGQQITFIGSGFRAGETVTATVNSDPVVLDPQEATIFGTVSYTWTVPADFDLGPHSIVLEAAGGRIATAAFSVTADPAAQVCVARAVDGGSLTWGVKTRFREYILGSIANGEITFKGSTTSASEFTWTGATGSINTNDTVGRASWTGTLAFSGHGGILDLRLSNPRIQIASASTAYLILDVYSTNSSGAVVTNGTVTFAQIALPSGAIGADSVSVSGASAWLTSAGATAFGGFYEPGEALDPISFQLALGGNVPCDDYSDPLRLAATGSTGSVGGDAVWIGALMLALGGAALVLRRRRRAA